jgi:hypothetical protein
VKRWIRLVIAAVVIAALVVVLVLVTRGGDEESTAATVEPDPDRVTILEIPRETITSILVERDNGELDLVRGSDDLLTPVYRYNVAWNRPRVDRILGSAANLSSRRVIEEAAEDLAPYGLDAPSIEVRISTDDGVMHLLRIGSRTPSGDGYYVTTGSDSTVYSVSTTWVSPFFYSLDDLRERSLPQLNPQGITEIRIDTLEGRTIRAERLAEDDGDPEMALTVLAITEPYARRYQASTNWLETVSGALQGLAIGPYIDDDPRDLTGYGLQPPAARVTVADENAIIDVLLGDLTDGGRFARMADGGPVFVLRGAEGLIRTRPYDTLSPFVFIINIDLVDSFAVEGNGARYVGEIRREPGEGEEVLETYYLNGTEIEEDLFKDLYQWIIGLQLDAEAERTVAGTAEVGLTYNLNTGAGSTVIEFVPYDVNYYAAFRDGIAEFIITRAKVGRMLNAFADAAAGAAE